MGNRFVRPETAKLPISDGDWLIVRKRLSHGEQRTAFARMYLAGADGTLRANPFSVGMETVTAYLLDWSLQDADGQPVVIRGVPVDELTAKLDALSPEDFGEIRTVIEQHELAMAAERAEAKKKATGATGSDPTSPSPSAPGSPSTTSEPLTLTTTRS
jgi:hypothetical protein